ncbi:hypothetical protein [Pedobacter mendelii]|nr:hypothetical protein [Pedobacter mendelii]
MISVFKTNVHSEIDLNQLISNLNHQVPDLSWNIDLSDCDKILRIDSSEDVNDIVVSLLNRLGFNCIVLEVFYTAPI